MITDLRKLQSPHRGITSVSFALRRSPNCVFPWMTDDIDYNFDCTTTLHPTDSASANCVCVVPLPSDYGVSYLSRPVRQVYTNAMTNASDNSSSLYSRIDWSSLAER
ncbi:hypothetical protein J6590_102091 [Homalodisca vitripennis]|nr:hypothetical protein J6590_102091 [Homalodisca vitripennis]